MNGASVLYESRKPSDTLSEMREKKTGAPGRIRTADPLVRSQMLYPAELRAHGGELHEDDVADLLPRPPRFAKGRFLVSHWYLVSHLVSHAA